MDADKSFLFEDLEKTAATHVTKEDGANWTVPSVSPWGQPSSSGNAQHAASIWTSGKSVTTVPTAGSLLPAPSAISTVQKSMSMPIFPVIFSDSDGESGGALRQPPDVAVSGPTGGLVGLRPVNVEAVLHSSGSTSKAVINGSRSVSSSFDPSVIRSRPKAIVQEHSGVLVPPLPPRPLTAAAAAAAAAASSQRLAADSTGTVGNVMEQLDNSNGALPIVRRRPAPPMSTVASRSNESVLVASSQTYGYRSSAATDLDVLLQDLDKAVRARDSGQAVGTSGVDDDDPPLIDLTPMHRRRARPAASAAAVNPAGMPPLSGLAGPLPVCTAAHMLPPPPQLPSRNRLNPISCPPNLFLSSPNPSLTPGCGYTPLHAADPQWSGGSSALAAAMPVRLTPVSVRRVAKPSDDLLDLSADVAPLSTDSYRLRDFDPLASPDAASSAIESRLEQFAARKPPYAVVPVQQLGLPAAGAAAAAAPASSSSSGVPVTGAASDPGSPVATEDAALQDPFSVEELSMALLVQTRARRGEAALRVAVFSDPNVVASETKQRPAERRPQTTAISAENREVDRVVVTARRHTDVDEQHAKCFRSVGWQESEDELKAFCGMVSRLKGDYLSDDEYTNLGIVLSATVAMPRPESVSVKVEIQTSFKSEPVAFTCDVNTAVEAVVGNTLCMVMDDQLEFQPDYYMLRIAGLMEYLMTDSCLSEYEYVRQSLKFDDALRFVLDDVRTMERPFKRSADDDQEPVYMINYNLHGDRSHKRTPSELNDLIGTYLKQLDLVRTSVVRAPSEASIKEIRIQGLMQSVKCITTLLGNAETLEIRSTLLHLKKVTSESEPLKSQVLLALDNLSKDVADLLLMYCKTFRIDYRLPAHMTSIIPQKPEKDVKELTAFLDNVIVHVASAHRLPPTVQNRFDQYKVTCRLYHGVRQLFAEVSTPSQAISKTSTEGVFWDCWLELSDAPLCTLPRETRLLLTLLGYDQKLLQWLPLGWVAANMFDHKGNLAQGGQMLSLWPGSPVPEGTTGSNIWQAQSVLLLINLPQFDWVIKFPEVETLPQYSTPLTPSVTEQEKQNVLKLTESDTSLLSKEQLSAIWGKRFELVDIPAALPLVLLGVPCWNYAGISSVLAVLRVWRPPPLLISLTLLLPRYPNTEVRQEAVRWLQEFSSDELAECMPQLIQVLKFESYHDSPLARLLLERSMTNVRFAHRLYWALKDAAAHQPQYNERFKMLYGGLVSVIGSRLSKELEMEDRLSRLVGSVAEKVKEARDKETVLERELWHVSEELREGGMRRLPINPGMVAKGVDSKLCTYFNSFTTPLRLVFSNADESFSGHYLMYKIGDDIRQDMLVMQIIRQMDQLWQKHDLDLRMMTFNCLPLGEKRGFVELITSSETLRKIQLSNGIAGSFKDRPVSEWLRKHNPTESGYLKAVENFTLTCAGCCVATYILGICDRHNDNIMLKTTGHMFHIDFSKFLGDAQMFGKIKRDRAPFVFTSDMAYVINGGDKPTEKFQQFIDLCCEAFNIVRRNSESLLTLIAAMQQCGIPGVNADGLAYVQQALLPGKSEWEATTHFTLLIEESLKSVFTQINFFFHNLAQLKFFNHNDGELLSFAPKTYSMATDGKIKSVEIISYQKRYIPEKHYVYVIQVDREKQKDPTLVFRRYSEFQEFHTKLMDMFPNARLPVLPGSIVLGRTHVQRVAERRRCDIERFLRELFRQQAEIAEHDLVYTFFHPMQRDEKETDRGGIGRAKDSSDITESERSITGQVKLSIKYSNGVLSVMVMHAKRLANETGEPPHPYVKTYLLPDPIKSTKRKTKTARSTFNPTYNEMLLYRLPLSDVRRRTLQVSVWSDGVVRENLFLGQVNIPIAQLDLSKDTTCWYALAALPDRSSMDGLILA